MKRSTSSRLPKNAFEHYSLKHRLTAWVSSTFFDRYVYTVRHGLLTGMRRRGGLGWLPAYLASSTETREVEFWRHLRLKNAVVYEAGAFQGLITLYLAREAQQVVAFEPNPKSRKRLSENLRLNGVKNVQVRDTGLGSQIGKLTLFTTDLMPGGASVDRRLAGDMERSGAIVSTTEIALVTVDSVCEAKDAPPPDLIKLDVEGWELEALRGARRTLERFAPALFVEMHGETMVRKREKAAEIIAFLSEMGYQDIRHVESGATLAMSNTDTAAEGHIFCSGRNDRVKSTFAWSTLT